jgi:hypothetical protein
MPIGTEMKRLTKDIASSREKRARRLGEIRDGADEARGEALSLIMGFEALRQETNRRLRKNLAHDKALRKSEARGILREAQDILRGFEASRKEASARLRRDLSQGTLVIRSEAQAIQAEAQNLTKGFRISRQELCSRLTKELHRSRVKARSEVEKLLENAQNLVKYIQTYRREAGSQLREDLAQSRASISSDVKQMQSDFRKARRAIRANLKVAATAWHELAGGKTLSKPRVTVESPDYKTRLLVAVNKYPEGITLRDAAGTLGVAPVVLGRVSKTLVDKGEIRKEGKLYFPLASK